MRLLKVYELFAVIHLGTNVSYFLSDIHFYTLNFLRGHQIIKEQKSVTHFYVWRFLCCYQSIKENLIYFMGTPQKFANDRIGEILLLAHTTKGLIGRTEVNWINFIFSSNPLLGSLYVTEMCQFANILSI